MNSATETPAILANIPAIPTEADVDAAYAAYKSAVAAAEIAWSYSGMRLYREEWEGQRAARNADCAAEEARLAYSITDKRRQKTAARSCKAG